MSVSPWTLGGCSKRVRAWRRLTTRRRRNGTGVRLMVGSGARRSISLRCTPSAEAGLACNACLVILLILDPHFLSFTVAHDVASIICQALRRGVTRSKRRAVQCLRKAAEIGSAKASAKLAGRIYMGRGLHSSNFRLN
jgi:hypothetical protein